MDALSLEWEPDTVLVTGACPKGAEDLAARCWQHWGGQVERWPFDWDQPEGLVVIGRHRAMIQAGADTCLNFGGSTGRGSLRALAREAGLPVYGWTPSLGQAESCTHCSQSVRSQLTFTVRARPGSE
jgi:hypothetical protein